MSSDISSRESGQISGVALSLILVSFLLAGALGFGGWAFMSRQDYKDHADKKIEKAVAENTVKTQTEDAARYAEEAKNPLKSYTGANQFGSISVQYPKTWSAYIDEQSNGGTPVDNYFHPDFVPSFDDKGHTYGLRIQVVDQQYDRVVDQYKNDVNTQKLRASPYALPNLPDTVGTRLTGQLDSNKQGSIVILPMRNMTLKVWTESADYLGDFDNIILKNLKFSP